MLKVENLSFSVNEKGAAFMGIWRGTDRKGSAIPEGNGGARENIGFGAAEPVIRCGVP